MKIGLVGGSYQESSLPFDAQRSINLFPVFDEQGKEAASMYGTPGRELFVTCGSGPHRSAFTTASGRVFVVSGYSLYELFQDGSCTIRGTLFSRDSNVSMEENGFQLAICDGQKLYMFTFATNAFSQVTSANLPASVGTVTFIYGYFIVNQSGTGRFYISILYDGLTWAALDYATAESSPDELKRVINVVGLLFLMGTKTSEIWTNTGSSVFPFQSQSGATMEVGILAPHSAVAVGNSLFWVGRDAFGSGIVCRAEGYSPQRISTGPIERIIQTASAPEDIKAYSYQEDGDAFYIITGGGLSTTLCYDLNTQVWHERAVLNEEGSYEQDIAFSCTFGFGRHLVGDRSNGNVYTQSADIYSDNGELIVRDRIFTHLSDEGRRIRYNSLEIGFETGVGTSSGGGADPKVSLWISRDGARTWIGGYVASIGAIGEYLKRVSFRRIGIASQLTFKIRVVAPVKIAITGAYLR